jgi:hypothetical protein
LEAANRRKFEKEEKGRKRRKIYKMNFSEEYGSRKSCPIGIFK